MNGAQYKVLYSMNEAGSGVKIKYISLLMHAGKPHEMRSNSQSMQCCHGEIFILPDAGREAFWGKNLLQKHAGCCNFSSRTGLMGWLGAWLRM